MTRNANEAAAGAADISANIEGVAKAAEGTSTRARESEKAAQDLASIASLLSALIRQFKIERSDPRTIVAVPVRLSATDIKGQPLDQQVTTVNVSRKGARLRGVHGELRLGAHVSLSHMNKVEQFRIVSVGKANTRDADQMSVCANNPATVFWNDVIAMHSTAGADEEKFGHAAKLKARAAHLAGGR